jgi:hypothetical protein
MRQKIGVLKAKIMGLRRLKSHLSQIITTKFKTIIVHSLKVEQVNTFKLRTEQNLIIFSPTILKPTEKH